MSKRQVLCVFKIENSPDIYVYIDYIPGDDEKETFRVFRGTPGKMIQWEIGSVGFLTQKQLDSMYNGASYSIHLGNEDYLNIPFYYRDTTWGNEVLRRCDDPPFDVKFLGIPNQENFPPKTQTYIMSERKFFGLFHVVQEPGESVYVDFIMGPDYLKTYRVFRGTLPKMRQWKTGPASVNDESDIEIPLDGKILVIPYLKGESAKWGKEELVRCDDKSFDVSTLQLIPFGEEQEEEKKGEEQKDETREEESDEDESDGENVTETTKQKTIAIAFFGVVAALIVGLMSIIIAYGKN